MLATLDRTDELLLLCALDVPTLKNVRLSLQTLELLSFPPERIKVVLRKTAVKVGLNPKEVAGALERKIDFEVPADGAVALAVNRGNPLVLAEPKTDFSRQVTAIAKTLFATTPKPAGDKKRRLAFGRS
jgi:pilus assembly protein CpaE